MLDTKQINATALSLRSEVRSMLGSLGARKDDLDDACQDAFVLLVSYILPRYRAEHGKLETYALSMVRKRWLNSRTRKWSAREETAMRDDGTSVLDDEACPHGFAVFERAIEAQHIRVAMERLSERERALLAAFEGCKTWKEAGEAIGVSEATVSRLRAGIREKMAD